MSKRRELLKRWTLVTVVIAVATGLWAFRANVRDDPTAAAPDGQIEGLTSILSHELDPELVRLRFEDASADSGIEFMHMPATRSSMLPEDMGPGLAWGDFDDDGDPDLFLVNFAGSVMVDGPEEGTARPALFRNDGGHFTDITAAFGLAEPIFGIGASWADFDGDGDLDLYLTAFGPNRLYRNDGDRFVEIASAAGVDDAGFGAGVAWGDYDHDGDIDLYLTNYVDFDLEITARMAQSLQYEEETPVTINPSTFPPAANRLYRNNGQGGFEEVAMAAGVDNAEGRSLSAAWMDFDSDGWLDLYVANDVSDNGVFRNLGDGTFEDIGASSLAADYRGAMGLGIGDPDADADLDIFVTHWLAQENAFFENQGSDGITDRYGEERLFFMDTADLLGLGQATLNLVGWATGFSDFDADGDLDLWLVNGHTLQQRDDPTRLIPQRVQIYQREAERFYEVSETAAGEGALPVVGRGGATADFDGDGRQDLIVAVHGGAPRLLRNTTEDMGHWVMLDLRMSGANTRALGARVTVTTAGRSQVQQSGTWGNYLSQSDDRLYFGVGSATQVDRIEVQWPDGTRTEIQNLTVDQVHRIAPY
jgi:enediyne biosynthesis protein E4